MKFTPQEIEAIIAIVAGLVPTIKAEYDKIAANSGGTVRPLADIFADTDATIAVGEAAAEKEIGQ